MVINFTRCLFFFFFLLFLFFFFFFLFLVLVLLIGFIFDDTQLNVIQFGFRRIRLTSVHETEDRTNTISSKLHKIIAWFIETIMHGLFIIITLFLNNRLSRSQSTPDLLKHAFLGPLLLLLLSNVFIILHVINIHSTFELLQLILDHFIFIRNSEIRIRQLQILNSFEIPHIFQMFNFDPKIVPNESSELFCKTKHKKDHFNISIESGFYKIGRNSGYKE